jgi:hypothetical protein
MSPSPSNDLAFTDKNKGKFTARMHGIIKRKNVKHYKERYSGMSSPGPLTNSNVLPKKDLRDRS